MTPRVRHERLMAIPLFFENFDFSDKILVQSELSPKVLVEQGRKIRRSPFVRYLTA